MRVVSTILQPIKSFTESFVDDFAVISSDWEEHKLHLHKFFTVMGEPGLTLKLEKCGFAQPKAFFRSHYRIRNHRTRSYSNIGSPRHKTI